MFEDGSEERYSGCIIATHAPDTLRILGEEATHQETRTLGSFNYVYRYANESECIFMQHYTSHTTLVWNFCSNKQKK